MLGLGFESGSKSISVKSQQLELWTEPIYIGQVLSVRVWVWVLKALLESDEFI